VSSSDERAARIAAVGYDYATRALEPVRACNLCGSAHHVEVAHHDRYGFPVVLVVCARCGLGFISPRPTAVEYGAFYAHYYRPLVSAYHGRQIDAQTVQSEQRVYADRLIRFLRSHLPGSPSTVLDIGGSTGVVASAIQVALGSAPTVVDPAPDELGVAAAMGIETVAAFAEEFDPGPRRWQLVLLCQTIDHLLDVSSAIELRTTPSAAETSRR